jgi:hypothetical protein
VEYRAVSTGSRWSSYDPNLVANAGLLVPATLMVRLALEALVNGPVT